MANIFLLEDDMILSKGISIALKKDEHTVTAVYGYLEALQKYQNQKYDLFLLDINLQMCIRDRGCPYWNQLLNQVI